MFTALSGCQNVGTLVARPSVRQVLEHFEIPDGAGDVDSLLGVEVYVDLSGTMPGFVSRTTTSKTLYTETLEFLGSNWAGAPCSYLGMGDSVVPLNDIGGPMSVANKRWLYTHSTTRLGELIEWHCNREAKDRAIVILTDLVQSNKSSDQAGDISNWNYVADGIARHLRSGGWQLIAAKSKFDGEYWPECDGESFDATCQRPFYVMIFAPNERQADLLSERFLANPADQRWRDHFQTLTPRVSGVSLQLMGFTSCDTGKYSNQRADDFRLRSSEFEHGVGYLIWYARVRESSCFSLMFGVDIQKTSASLVEYDPENMLEDLHFLCYEWTGVKDEEDNSQPCEFKGNLVTECRFLSQPRDSAEASLFREIQVNVEVDYPSWLESQRWYVWHSSALLNVSSQALPEWVTNWSTNNDADQSEITKTLNLSKVMHAAVREHLLADTLLDFYLVTEVN